MKLKRFKAKDMRQALNMVREQFGSDAVIMSNQTLEDGVEVVAAIDVDEKQLTQPLLNEIKESNDLKKFEWQHDGEFNELKSEITGIKDVLAHYLAECKNDLFNISQPIKASLKQKLQKLQISESVQMHLLADLTDRDFDSAWQTTLTKLTNLIPQTKTELARQGGAVAVIGPSGSGKTMTLAKMMARNISQFGADQCAFICADTHRIGSSHQLATFAKLFQVPLLIAESQVELQQHLNSLLNKRCVLIDTPGFNPNQPALTNLLHDINLCTPKVNCILTIPTNLTQKHLESVFQRFNTPNLTSCVITKLDEATSLGETLSFIIEKELPITYCANGQTIPDHLTISSPTQLTRLALELQQKYETDHKGVSHAFIAV